ncbi:MAG: phospholipase D-like domain-containing protein, partial [Gaiella sp.]
MIAVHTLTDGGQTAEQVADALIAMIGSTRSSLDLALYDIRVRGETEARGRAALEAAVERGVAVRLVYELEEEGRDPLPAPPGTEPETIEAEPFPTHGVSTRDGLMHHKYAVLDERRVWTGSLNWTEDSWSRQENVVVVIDSPELAHAYRLNLEELWHAETVEDTGRVEPRPVDVGGATVRPWFCPGHGEELAHRIAKHIGKAKRRVRIASPVLSSGPILGTLVEIVNERRCDVAGVVDDTQVDQVFWQWKSNGVSEWKIPLLHTVLTKAPFSGKESTRWSP